jgi:hypothetical protein
VRTASPPAAQLAPPRPAAPARDLRRTSVPTEASGVERPTAPTRGLVGWGLTLGLVAALPLLAVGRALARAGWRPVGDEAIIAWRAWDVIAGHGPLVGQYSQASAGRGIPVFNAGPLVSWALSVPTHLAPGMGPAAGALVVSALAVLVACTAATMAGGRGVGFALAAGALLLQWSMAAVIDGSPAWNPHVALLPFAAVLVLAWVVASGHLGWSPALVLFTSFCVQTHLMFASAAVICLVGLTVGVFLSADRRRAVARSLPATVVVGGVCWLPALWQQATQHPGNLAALWRSTATDTAPVVGHRYAALYLDRVLGPVTPSWLRPPGPVPHPIPLMPPPPGHPVAFFVALALLAVVAVTALRRHRTGLAAGAVIALTADLAAFWVLSNVTLIRATSIAYIQFILWPIGLVTYAVLGYACGLAVRDVLAHPAGHRRLAVRHAVPSGAVAGAGALLVAAMALSGWEYGRAPGYELTAPSRQAITAAAVRLTTIVGPPPRHGARIAVLVPQTWALDLQAVQMATAYRLRTLGWEPAVDDQACVQGDPAYCARPGDPAITVAPPGTPVAGERVGDVGVFAGPTEQTYAVWLDRR